MAAKPKRKRTQSGGKAKPGKRHTPTTRTKKPKATTRSAATAPRATRAPAAAGEGNEDKQTITLSAAGPLPRMRIEVTQLQLGEYNVSLWDRDQKNPKEVARSTNDDEIEDEFAVVPTLAELREIDRFTLFWVVWIKALKVGPGARYFVSVTVTQGGEEIVRFERQGPMTKKFMPFNGEWLLRVV